MFFIVAAPGGKTNLMSLTQVVLVLGVLTVFLIVVVVVLAVKIRKLQRGTTYLDLIFCGTH